MFTYGTNNSYIITKVKFWYKYLLLARSLKTINL